MIGTVTRSDGKTSAPPASTSNNANSKMKPTTKHHGGHLVGVGVAKDKLPPASQGFGESTGGHTRRLSIRGFRRIKPTSPLSSIKGTLSRRARSKSGCEFALEPQRSEEGAALSFRPSPNAYAIGARKGPNATDSGTECFGDISSGADVGGIGGEPADSDEGDVDMMDGDYDDDGATSSSTNSATLSTVTPKARNKGSPIARLMKRSVRSKRRKVKSVVGGDDTTAIGRSWLESNSPLDSMGISCKSLDGSNMESRRPSPPRLTLKETSLDAGHKMRRGTSLPLSTLSRLSGEAMRQVQIGEAGAGLPPQAQPQAQEQMPRATSVALPLDGKAGGRGRMSWRGLVPSASRKIRSESPTASGKGSRNEQGRSRTPSGREASKLPSPGGVPSVKSSPGRERYGVWSVFRDSRYVATADVSPWSKSLPLSSTSVFGGGSSHVAAELKSTLHQSKTSDKVPGEGIRREDCTVKTPPSKLRYGDRLRLWARTASPKNGLEKRADRKPLAVSIAGEGSRRGVTPISMRGYAGAAAAVVGSSGGGASGGYVGSCDRTDRVHQKLWRRSELAIIGTAEEEGGEYVDCHFHVLDPEGKRKEGDDVCFGDVVLLLDDRNFAWNENTNGLYLAGSLMMIPQGSKKQIAVSFRRPGQAMETYTQDNDRQVVLFGEDTVQIMPEDMGSTRKRRTRKWQPLTAYRKKGAGTGIVSGAYLCMGGRGEPLLFELHLPSEPRAGDLSPVVTKVIIHMEEREEQRQQEQQKRLVSLPPFSPTLPEGGEYSLTSNASTAPLSDCGSYHGGDGRLPLVSTDPCSQTTATAAAASWGLTSVRSSDVWSKAAGKREMVPVEHAVTHASEASWERETKGAKRSLKGLKWGDYIRFKYQASELSPDDVLTMRLSNGMSATLTSSMLKEKAGQGEFPVKARMTKIGSTDDLANLSPNPTGLVFLKCQLTPLNCPAEAGKATAVANKSKASLWCKPRVLKNGLSLVSTAWGVGGLVLTILLTTLGLLAVALSSLATGEQQEKRVSVEEGKGVVNRTGFVKGRIARKAREGEGVLPKGAWSLLRRSFLTLAVLYTLTSIVSSILSMFHVWPLWSPCKSIRDLHQPDGRAYPPHQLAATVATIEAVEGSVPNPKSVGISAAALGSKDSRGEDHTGGEGGEVSRRMMFSLSVPSDTPDGEEEQPMSPAKNNGGGDAGDRNVPFPRTSSTSSIHSSRLGSSARNLARVVGEQSGSIAQPEGVDRRWWGARTVGRMIRSVKACLSLAVLCIAFLVMNGLFGWSTQGREAAEDGPMQADVHLMRWDGRSVSEAVDGENMVQDTYLDPPSGSNLAPMPYRYLVAENMDVEKAWQRWEATLAWRKENNADDILKKPHPKFSLIKSKYAHCFHLPDKDGRLTYYERPGRSELIELKKLGVTKQELLDHYMYCMEYLWQVLQPKQTQRITIVIDLAGVKFMDLVGESVVFLKTTVSMMSKHYPQRSFKILILNAPSFFNQIFALVKPMLNEATKKKIDLLSAMDGMLNVIPKENLPGLYGGESPIPLMQSPAEVALLAHTEKVLRDSNLLMER